MPHDYNFLALALALVSCGSTTLTGCGGTEFEAGPGTGGGTARDAAFERDAHVSNDGPMSPDRIDERSEAGDRDPADRPADGKESELSTDGARAEADATDARAETDEADADGDRSDSASDGGDARSDSADSFADAADSARNSDGTGVADTKDAADADSSSIDGGADAECDAPVPFYRDRDGDGFGVTGESIFACTAPPASDAGAWVARPGDCRDDLYEVKPYVSTWPNPPMYSGTGYSDPTKPQGVSFDFDCNGAEQPDPANLYGTQPNCPALATNCKGSGYMPANPARTGTGINAHCGSTRLRTCQAQGLNCNPVDYDIADAFRCR